MLHFNVASVLTGIVFVVVFYFLWIITHLNPPDVATGLGALHAWWSISRIVTVAVSTAVVFVVGMYVGGRVFHV